MTEPTSPCILVVDDEASIRAVLRDVLEVSGYQVVEAPGANEAFEAFSQTALALVLTDYDMPPGPNGVELARMIREKSPATPVVLVSGDPPRDLPPDLFAKVLLKPIDINTLLGTITALTKAGNRDR